MAGKFLFALAASLSLGISIVLTTIDFSTDRVACSVLNVECQRFLVGAASHLGPLPVSLAFALLDALLIAAFLAKGISPKLFSGLVAAEILALFHMTLAFAAGSPPPFLFLARFACLSMACLILGASREEEKWTKPARAAGIGVTLAAIGMGVTFAQRTMPAAFMPADLPHLEESEWVDRTRVWPKGPDRQLPTLVVFTNPSCSVSSRFMPQLEREIRSSHAVQLQYRVQPWETTKPQQERDFLKAKAGSAGTYLSDDQIPSIYDRDARLAKRIAVEYVPYFILVSGGKVRHISLEAAFLIASGLRDGRSLM